MYSEYFTPSTCAARYPSSIEFHFLLAADQAARMAASDESPGGTARSNSRAYSARLPAPRHTTFSDDLVEEELPADAEDLGESDGEEPEESRGCCVNDHRTIEEYVKPDREMFNFRHCYFHAQNKRRGLLRI